MTVRDDAEAEARRRLTLDAHLRGHNSTPITMFIEGAAWAAASHDRIATAETIERAADAMFFEDCGEAVSDEYRATEDFDAKFREYARVALVAALEPTATHSGEVDA